MNSVRFAFAFCLLMLMSGRLLAQHRYEFRQQKMGSPFTITCYDSRDSVKMTNVIQQGFQLVDSLITIFSDYQHDSEINRLSREGVDQPFTPSTHLWTVMSIAAKAYRESKGTFDVTIGPLTHLWRAARRTKQFPDSMSIFGKKKKVGFRFVQMDEPHRAIRLTQAGVEFDFGGIAQGYIAQQLADRLVKEGIRDFLIDVSGDIVCRGAPPGKSGWQVGIVSPKNNEALPYQVSLKDKAITTSGDLYQFMEYRGKRYSHLVDPRTGYGLTTRRLVTVIAEDGTTADWLTKACSLLPFHTAEKICRRHRAALLIIELKNDNLVFHTSKNFRRYWKPD